ncbi:MAG: GNAT family N-acetyltransferase [Verrucomicrobia bacterium]|nr:GNAT family N-acetyltransferase [Verrucomicrobiota bacterium]
MNAEVEYLPDDEVEAVLDAEIRGLLTTCFTKPQDVVFRDRRYFIEPYPHSWIIRDPKGIMVAHIGVHEKQLEAGGQAYAIGGIAEVCVHPACRGRGYVGLMLNCIHAKLLADGFVFAVLMGDPRVYGSSGYVSVENLKHGGDDVGWTPLKAMVRPLSQTPWPDGEVRLPGPEF